MSMNTHTRTHTCTHARTHTHTHTHTHTPQNTHTHTHTHAHTHTTHTHTCTHTHTHNTHTHTHTHTLTHRHVCIFQACMQLSMSTKLSFYSLFMQDCSHDYFVCMSSTYFRCLPSRLRLYSRSVLHYSQRSWIGDK